MLTDEQAKQIKEQILKQVESWPEEQRTQAQEQIESMNNDELEQFLAKNKMLKGEEPEKQECVFCSIIQGKVPSYKIEENKSSIAILEINPLSPGHMMILSKTHGRLPNSAFTLANKIAKRIKRKLKPEEIKIENVKILTHEIVQVIPIYKGKKLEKTKAEEKELILMQDKLKFTPKPKKIKKKPDVSISSLPKAPRRTP